MDLDWEINQEKMKNTTINFTSEASANSSHDLYLTRLDLSMYSISFIFGFPTHSYVLWLIVTGSSGVSSEFFNLNLCVCELGICLNSVLTVFFYCIGISHIMTSFLLGLIVSGRALFQSLICLERYLAVVHPVTFLKYKPLRYRVICCAAAWIISLGSCFCCMITIERIQHYVYFSLSQDLLYLSIQLFCLVTVLKALKQSRPGERTREKEENHMKRRAFFIILVTTVTTFIIYIPYIIAGLSFTFTKHFITDFYSFGFSCYILAGFVQPILYLHRSGKLYWLSLILQSLLN